MIVKSFEKKVFESGKSRATIVLEDGRTIYMWGDHPQYTSLSIGQSLEGDLTRGEYKGKEQLTLKNSYKPSTFTPKKNEIAKAQERKAGDIERAQERKQEAINMSAAMRDAVLMVTNYYPEAATMETEAREDFLREKITKWRLWFLDESKDVGVPF